MLTHALEANNWTNNKQRNHHWLQSWVLTACNNLNGTMSPWAWCSLAICTALATSVYTKMLCVKFQWSILTSDTHSAWGSNSTWSLLSNFNPKSLTPSPNNARTQFPIFHPRIKSLPLATSAFRLGTKSLIWLIPWGWSQPPNSPWLIAVWCVTIVCHHHLTP